MPENTAANISPQSWIKIGSAERADLEKICKERSSERIKQGLFTEQDVANISKRQISVIDGELSTTDERLEMLRRMCQLWDVNLKPGEITSHRPLVGPVIVAIKKLMLPIMRMLFKKTLRQQRDFNAAAINLFAELLNETKADR